MKINQTTGLPVPLRPAPNRTSTAAAGEPDAQRVDSHGGNVRQLPDSGDNSRFDAAKVSRLREEIRAGRYKIDPERIADGLIEDLKQTLRRPQ